MGVYDLSKFWRGEELDGKLPEKPVTVKVDNNPLDEKAITFNVKDLELMKQGDLFNGWPEDGEPNPLTVNTEINK